VAQLATLGENNYANETADVLGCDGHSLAGKFGTDVFGRFADMGRTAFEDWGWRTSPRNVD
jgi:hypothetical protein